MRRRVSSEIMLNCPQFAVPRGSVVVFNEKSWVFLQVTICINWCVGNKKNKKKKPLSCVIWVRWPDAEGFTGYNACKVVEVWESWQVSFFIRLLLLQAALGTPVHKQQRNGCALGRVPVSGRRLQEALTALLYGIPSGKHKTQQI